jgi:hypothetical protein
VYFGDIVGAGSEAGVWMMAAVMKVRLGGWGATHHFVKFKMRFCVGRLASWCSSADSNGQPWAITSLVIDG